MSMIPKMLWLPKDAIRWREYFKPANSGEHIPSLLLPSLLVNEHNDNYIELCQLKY